MLEAMGEALEYPVYVARDGNGRDVMDRVSNEGGRLTRKRYFITARQQCTCIGFMKFGKCKHLKMLTGDDSWVKRGVPASIAIEETIKLIGLLAQAFGKDNVQPIGLLDENEIPEIVKVVVITVKADDLKDLGLVACLKKFGSIGDLGVMIRVEKK